jgi:hypothetical protein
MAGVYWLAAALQRIEKDLDAKVSVKDAQNFIRYCKALVSILSLEVGDIIESESSSRDYLKNKTCDNLS